MFKESGNEVYEQDRPAWHLWGTALHDPEEDSVIAKGLGSAMKPISRFSLPTGRRDGKWLVQHNSVFKDLNNLWREPGRH